MASAATSLRRGVAGGVVCPIGPTFRRSRASLEPKDRLDVGERAFGLSRQGSSRDDSSTLLDRVQAVARVARVGRRRLAHKRAHRQFRDISLSRSLGFKRRAGCRRGSCEFDLDRCALNQDKAKTTASPISGRNVKAPMRASERKRRAFLANFILVCAASTHRRN